MKKIFTLAILFICAISSWAYDVKIDGIYYNLNKNTKSATVTYGDVIGYYEEDIVIPETITSDGNDYTIVALGDSAFWYCRKMTSLTMPNTVKTIAADCLAGCEMLSKCVMSNSIETVCERAFAADTQIKSLDLPETLKTVKENAFFRIGLTSLVLPNSLETIEKYGFSQMESVKEIKIGDGLKYLGSSAFSDCKLLESIEIPACVDSIRMYTFEGCENMKEVKFNEGLKFIDERAFALTSLNNVVLPNSLDRIEFGAFRYISTLKNITFGEGIKNVGEWLFYGGWLPNSYNTLETITILAPEVPETATELFKGCDVSNCTLYVPEGSVEAYKAASPWNQVGTILPIGSAGINNTLLNGNGRVVYNINNHISIINVDGKNIKVIDNK